MTTYVGPAIAIDVDDTIAPLFSPFIEWHNGIYHTKASFDKVEDFTTLAQLFSIDQKELIRRVHDYVRNRGLEVLPIDGAIEALDKLRTIFPMQVLVSGRQRAIRGASDQYFEKYFSGRKFKTFLCNHFVGNDGMSKSEACRLAGAGVLIEDSLEYAVECARNGITVLLFGNYPWNRSPIPEEFKCMITRTPTWRDVLVYFDL